MKGSHSRKKAWSSYCNIILRGCHQYLWFQKFLCIQGCIQGIIHCTARQRHSHHLCQARLPSSKLCLVLATISFHAEQANTVLWSPLWIVCKQTFQLSSRISCSLVYLSYQAVCPASPSALCQISTWSNYRSNNSYQWEASPHHVYWKQHKKCIHWPALASIKSHWI